MDHRGQPMYQPQTQGSEFQQPQGQPQQEPSRSVANYKFTPDEIRVLKECDYEAFFQRSLPFGTGLGVAAYYAVKAGYLKPNIKWGPAPKVVVGAIIGYFLGKVSYQMKCAEKLMQLPNSQLGEMLRLRRKGGLYENFSSDQGFGAGLALAPFQSATEQYSDGFSRKSSALNLDTERPSPSGLDDTHRPNVDGTPITFDDDLPLDPPKHQTTYDELRQQNREEYAKKAKSPFYKPITAEPSQPVNRPPPPSLRTDDGNSPKGAKNKYGDVWTQ